LHFEIDRTTILANLSAKRHRTNEKANSSYHPQDDQWNCHFGHRVISPNRTLHRFDIPANWTITCTSAPAPRLFRLFVYHLRLLLKKKKTKIGAMRLAVRFHHSEEAGNI
jgi:hypothetical protein